MRYVNFRQRQRLKALNRQLPDTLSLLDQYVRDARAAVTERPEALGEIIQQHQNFPLCWLQLLTIDESTHPHTFLLMKLMARVSTRKHPIGITYDDLTHRVWVCCYSGSIMVFQDA